MASFTPIIISTGLQLLAGLFKKPEKQQQIEFRSPNVNLGSEIPTFFGKVRIETTMIFPKTTDKMYRVERVTSKGKGGAKITTKKVYGTWMSLISANHCSIQTLIINGTHIDTSHDFYQNYCTFLDGTQTTAWSEAQILYPGFEGDIAYTGLSILCFKDVPLEKYGNTIPTEIAVIALDERLSTDPSVGYVVQTICEEAGIPNSMLDITEIIPLQLKTGFNVVQSGEGFRNALEQLMQFYQFGAVKLSNGKIKFKTFDRGNATATIINPNYFFPLNDDNGNTSQDGSSDRTFIRKLEDKQSLPSKITIKYFNQNIKYHQDSYSVSFPEYTKENIVNIDTTLSTYPYEVEERAMDLLKMNYLQSRLRYTFRISSIYYNLETLDTVQLPNGEICQLASVTHGNDFIIECEAFYYSGQRNYSLVPPFQQEPDLAPYLPNPNIPDVYILDIPQFEDNPPSTLYILATSPATLNFSFDTGDSYSTQVEHLAISTIGDCDTALPNVTGLDLVNDLDVTLTTGSLEQITQNQFNDGQNLALLGVLNPNGFYEGKLIRFRDVLLTAPNQYTLSYLYQGDYNTQSFDTSSLPLKFFLLRSPTTSYYSTIQRNTENLGSPMQVLPVVSDWQDLGATPITSVSGFNNNSYVIPPVQNITAEIDPDNNILIQWDDSYTNASPYQNGSEQATYQLKIYSDVAYTILERTEITNTNRYLYRFGDRTTDGVTIPFYITVARNNAITGYGQLASATINPTPSVVGLGVIDADLLQGYNGNYYLNRTNHTGTQLASTISDFSENVDDRVGNLLVAGNNISLDYNDSLNTLTINNGFTFGEKAVNTNYIVLLSDNCLVISATNSITITLPDGLPLYFQVAVRNDGTGTITMSATTTLQAVGTKIDVQYRMAHFYHSGSNIWKGTGYLVT